jgi:hypothetical protein
MAASFPNSVKNFTVKIDGFDNVMAEHINSLQDEVMAIENYLLGGWAAAVDAWEYVSATRFRVSGDKRTMFPVGTKIKLVQAGTTKYFYVTATSYASEYTTVTVTGGSDYSLDNQVITIAAYSYAATPQGFPQWFNYTPAWTSGGAINPVIGNGSLTGYFCINGQLVSAAITVTAGSTTTYGDSTFQFGLPVPAVGMVLGSWRGNDAGVANYSGVTYAGSTTTIRLSVSGGTAAGPTVPFTMLTGDSYQIWVDYRI